MSVSLVLRLFRRSVREQPESELSRVIKVIEKCGVKTPKEVEQIWQEILILRIITKSPHPNVVNFYDVFQLKNQIWLIMEFAGSLTLHELFKQRREQATPPGKIQTLVLQLWCAVAHIHSLRVCHLEVNGIVLKLADFGCATQTSELLHSMVGTLQFMAPEMLLHDAWSLGMLLIEALCTDDIIKLKFESSLTVEDFESYAKRADKLV